MQFLHHRFSYSIVTFEIVTHEQGIGFLRPPKSKW
ncbi:unnamed protein product, partial [Amoebophrya sp. A120]|eukprot:GSA120T00026314001.1